MTQNSSEYKWTCAPLLEGKIIGCLYGYLKKNFNSTALKKQHLLYSKYFRLIVWISCLWIQSTQCFSRGQQQAIPLTSVAAGVDLRFWMALALANIVCLQSFWQLLGWVQSEKKYCSGYFLLHPLLIPLQLFLCATFCSSIHRPNLW